MVLVNGKEYKLVGSSVSEMLEHLTLDQNLIVVEINKSIIVKRDFEHRILEAGDKIEVVRFVGGG